MSINDESSNKNFQPGAQPQGNTQSTQQSAPKSAIRGGAAAINSRLNLGNSRGQQQNIAKNVFDAVTEQVRTANYETQLSVTFMDNTIVPVALSAIVFHSAVGNKVITSTLLIEGSESARIKPFQVDYRGAEKIELARPATDLYDATTTAAVAELIRRDYTTTVDVIDVGANIIQIEVTQGATVADLIKSEQLTLALFYISNNLFAKIIELTGDTERQFSVGWAANDRQSRVRANIDKNPAPVTTSSGLPVRADFGITISTATNDTNNGAKFDVATDLTAAFGYIDLTYVDPREAAQAQSQVAGVQIDPNSITQTYIPRCVITRADSLLPLVTPELSLLAIASVTALSRDNGWIGMFAPKYAKKAGADLTDIGAIGFEAVHLTEDGQPARIDVKSDAFTQNPGNLVDLIHTALFPNLIYSSDIVECSDLGGIDSLYLAAAQGIPGAVQAVINHANVLTDGRFGELWEGGAIASYNNTLIPIGYYEDKDGNRHDLRTYDYLAFLNTFGDEDVSIAEKFAETLDNSNLPVYYRLAKAKEILTNTIGSSVTVKSFAHRIDWNPKFLLTLIEAIAKAGLVVESNSIGAYSASSNRRGNVAALNSALKFGGVTGFISYGGNNYGGSYAPAQTHNPYVQ